MRFGAHMSTAGGVHRAVERAVDIGADAVQIFTQSPRMWRPGNHSDENIARFRELMAEHAMAGAVAHAIYLINIASPDDELRAKSLAALSETMRVGELLGLDAAIFHPGSHKGEGGLDGCIDRMAEAIREVLTYSDSTWLLLENCAGQGGTIGRDTEELARLIDACGAPERLGICLDSCHWFASGVDVGDPSVLDAELDRVDAAIGLDRLRALHLNDSLTPLGSNRDRHANIGDGVIGDRLSTFVSHPRLAHLCAYLEVPGEGDGPTAEQLDAARALIREV